MHPHPWPAGPVGLEVPRRVTPHATGHARPGFGADQLAHPAVTDRPSLVVPHVHRHGKGRPPERAGGDRERDVAREEAGPHLGAAGDVDDRHPATADLVEQPHVRVHVPRLPGRAERAERPQIHAGVRRAPVRLERAHERGGHAQEVQAVALREARHAVGRRKVGRPVEHHQRAAPRVRPDRRPRAHDPAHVGDPGEPVSRVQIGLEVRLLRQLDEQAPVHVHRALWPAGRAGRVGDHHRVLRRHPHRVDRLAQGIVPVHVATRAPWDVRADVAVDHDMAHAGGILQRRVHGRLDIDLRPPARARVGGDHRHGARVDQPARDRLGREAREDRDDHRTHPGDRVERRHRSRRHRHHESDAVAVAHAERAKPPGQPGDVVGESAVRARGHLAVLAFGDHGLAIRGRCGVAADTAPRQVQLASDEPLRPLRAPARVEHPRVGRGEAQVEPPDDGVPEPLRVLDRPPQQLRMTGQSVGPREPRRVRRLDDLVGRGPDRRHRGAPAAG